MKRKGFTLIELLAVIVILSIIALIAIPIVINIINKVNKSAFKDTAYGIIKAGELYYSERVLNIDGVQKTVEFEFPNDIEDLLVKGSLPNSGSIRISRKGKIALAISNGKYCAKKGYDDPNLVIDENIKDCEIFNIMKSDNNCIKNPDIICPNGTKVNVKVNATENYDFYVINDTGEDLTLIMNKNLVNKTVWITQEDYVAAGGANWNSGNNSKGPLTALKTLKEKTNHWSNVVSYNYTLIDDGGGNRYKPIEVKDVRARMLTKTEANSLGCQESKNNTCPDYLIENLSSNNTVDKPYGYFLSSASPTEDLRYRAWYIWIYGNISSAGNVDSNYSCGLRPVINMSKLIY